MDLLRLWWWWYHHESSTQKIMFYQEQKGKWRVVFICKDSNGASSCFYNWQFGITQGKPCRCENESRWCVRDKKAKKGGWWRGKEASWVYGFGETKLVCMIRLEWEEKVIYEWRTVLCSLCALSVIGIHTHAHAHARTHTRLSFLFLQTPRFALCLTHSARFFCSFSFFFFFSSSIPTLGSRLPSAPPHTMSNSGSGTGSLPEWTGALATNTLHITGYHFKSVVTPCLTHGENVDIVHGYR